MQLTRGWRAAVLGVTGVLGAGLALAVVPATPAQAHGTPGNKYQGDVKGVQVKVAGPSYDQAKNQTTFTFTLKLNDGEPKVSHVLLMACPNIQIISATGPTEADGAPQPGSTSPEKDGSLKDEPGTHEGIKFDGYRGVYTITFAGNISGAEFVVKDGDGHAHFVAGSNVCQTVTPPQTPQENPPTENPPTNNPPAENPPTNNPPATPASNQPSQPGTEVQGASLTNPAALPSTDVLGTQESQPAALATLPRTGSDLTFLAPFGVLLVAFGRLARTAARRG